MTMKERPDTSRASTDVAEFMTDLDGGTFEHMLSAALSQTAAAVVDFDKKGEVVIKLAFERIAGTHQVRIGHSLKFSKPTGLGRVVEQADGASVLHVGKNGALSLAQPSLPGVDRQRSITD